VLNKDKAFQRWSAVTGFFFVEKRFEVSNLSLIRDMLELVELAEA
jgi:hypothetical protein